MTRRIIIKTVINLTMNFAKYTEKGKRKANHYKINRPMAWELKLWILRRRWKVRNRLVKMILNRVPKAYMTEVFNEMAFQINNLTTGLEEMQMQTDAIKEINQLVHGQVELVQELD